MMRFHSHLFSTFVVAVGVAGSEICSDGSPEAHVALVQRQASQMQRQASDLAMELAGDSADNQSLSRNPCAACCNRWYEGSTEPNDVCRPLGTKGWAKPGSGDDMRCAARSYVNEKKPDRTTYIWCSTHDVWTDNPYSQTSCSSCTRSTLAPTTAAPTTAAPTTASPTTASPTTAAPTTASPTTAAPTTAAPTTAAPTTASPTTAAPTTASPTTAAPTTAAPTTAAPTTASPTTATTTPAGPATAVGDPHLVNTRGEHFSIFASGQMEFIRVPYESATEKADFTVRATMQSFGETDKCKEAQYITGLLFGGSWFKGKPLEVSVDFIRPGATKKEMKVLLGGVPVMPSTDPIDLGDKMVLQMDDSKNFVLKVDEASVAVNLQYYFLNVEANAFTKLAPKIGGLLGEDDHASFSMKPEGCEREVLAKAAHAVCSSARMTE